MRAAFLLFLIAAGRLLAAPAGLPPGTPTSGTCQGTHGPGDRLACYITFRGDPEFTSLTLTFNPEPVQDPGALPVAFNLDKFRKIAPGIYEVADILPFATSGRCYLFSIVAGAGPGVYRDYVYGRQFFRRITINFAAEAESATDEKAHVTLKEPGSLDGEGPYVLPPAQKMTGKSEGPADDHASDHRLDAPKEKVTIGDHETAVPEAARAPKIKATQRGNRPVEVGPPPRGPSPYLFPNFRSLHGKSRKRPCDGGHKPGSKIACYVSFDGDSAFTSLYLSFYTPEVSYEQSGLCSSFLFQDSERINRRTYRVTGVLPACANGGYVLSGMMAHTLAGMRSYQQGVDYMNRFPAIQLENRNQTVFPDIVTIGSDPVQEK